jgi:hypothetical protein
MRQSRQEGSERQIRSTSAALLFEVPEQSSPLVVQELQIGGTGRKFVERRCLRVASGGL